jgi:hypothetical protein
MLSFLSLPARSSYFGAMFLSELAIRVEDIFFSFVQLRFERRWADRGHKGDTDGKGTSRVALQLGEGLVEARRNRKPSAESP